MIRIKSGVYGAKDGMKRSSDDPFSLSVEEEARLVARGVAEYVAETAPIGFDETPPELPELPDGVTAIPEYSAGMTAKELRDIGKMCGLTFKVGMSKEQMVAALDAHIEAHTVDEAEPVTEDTEEVAPDEDAPTFDASEAVQ